MAGKHTVDYNPNLESIEDKFKEICAKSNKRILIFNKESGEYMSTIITDSVKNLDSTYFKWKVKYFDDSEYQWVGDYDTGELVKIEDIPTEIDEEEVDQQIGMIVTESYPWFSQLNIMANVMKKLIEANAITGEEVDEFDKMMEFIEGRREQNRKYKKAYSEDPDFTLLSRRDKWNRMAKQFAGGLAEEMGPARATQAHNDWSNDVDVEGQHY